MTQESDNKQPSKQSANAQAVLTIIIFAVLGWYYFGGGMDKHVENQMEGIYSQVANDAVKQYQITRAGNDPIDICVHAGLVAASYVQSKDQANYLRWKDIEKNDCARAGIHK